MRATFKDFYGQYITVHNETGSGNIRIGVKTMPNLNQVAVTAESECTVETDISLNEKQLCLLLAFLKACQEDDA